MHSWWLPSLSFLLVQVFWGLFGSLAGGCLGIWPVVFCFVTRSSVWCHGGLGPSPPPVLNVIYLSILVNFKTKADTTLVQAG